jgi:hypothetical protein
MDRTALRNQLRVVTTGPDLNLPAVDLVLDAIVAASDPRLSEHAQLFLSDDFDEIRYEARELLSSLPDNNIYGYIRTPLPDGTTEWVFSTTHGVGDNECGMLMGAIAAVLAWPEASAAAGVVSIVTR